ncbi:MAG TPA: hypothetical protein VJK03_03585 [Candidatus Nanoarchaeia archaeon]|nr:hypothetical protein [Candidatus Nanoarchaeia archaeon]
MPFKSKLYAHIPSSDRDIRDFPEDGLYYIVNTFVSEKDGNRVIGPLTREELEQKKEQYEDFVSRYSDSQRKKYPFLAYYLTKEEPRRKQ